MVNFDRFLHLLNSMVYRRYAQPAGGAQMDAQISNTILPPILTLIQLRRTMSDELDVLEKMVKVATEVPPYRIMTVELKMNGHQTRVYKRVHSRFANMLGAGAGAEPGHRCIGDKAQVIFQCSHKWNNCF